MPVSFETSKLAKSIRAYCPHDGRFNLPAGGAHVVRYSRVSKELIHSTPRPILCIVAQGAKTVMLGQEVLQYDASRMLVVSVDLPVAGQVTKASPAEPYLSLVLDLNPQRIADLLLKVFPHGLPRAMTAENRGMYLGQADGNIVNAATRLMELMAEPEEAELLVPLVIDEILIRLLRGPVGARVAQIGLAESSVHRVGKAIEWLRAHYAQPMKVDELADLANMSVSSFHQHFKAVTSMSPLHYQKVLRLQEARRLMLATMMDAGDASRRVGYLSASQFSREYARFFGTAPTRDVARLMEQGLTAADVTRSA